MAAIEVVADKATKQLFPPAAGITQKLTDAMLARGLYTRVAMDCICIAPPLVTADAETRPAGGHRRRRGTGRRHLSTRGRAGDRGPLSATAEHAKAPASNSPERSRMSSPQFSGQPRLSSASIDDASVSTVSRLSLFRAEVTAAITWSGRRSRPVEVERQAERHQQEPGEDSVGRSISVFQTSANDPRT